jgi:hypothetical protein
MPEPQTRSIDPFDTKFKDWVAAQGTTSQPPPLPPEQDRRPEGQLRQPNGGGDGGTGGGPSVDRGRQLLAFHAYVNSRLNVDWNTCGQAAIASMADFHGTNPYGLPRVGQYWDDGAAIDATISGGFGPDVIFGWGTTGGRIRDALLSYGRAASVGFSGLASAGWQDQWAALQTYVAQGLPVPVLIDVGKLRNGPWWTAHWPIVYRIENGLVYVGNCSWEPVIDESTFLSAWHCWFLPYGFNHCAVYSY